MELTVKLDYEEVVKLVRQLSASKLKQLKMNLDEKYIAQKASKEITNFQNFLLSGPTMTDNQYAEFKENRKRINQWRRQN